MATFTNANLKDFEDEWRKYRTHRNRLNLLSQAGGTSMFSPKQREYLDNLDSSVMYMANALKMLVDDNK